MAAIAFFLDNANRLADPENIYIPGFISEKKVEIFF